VSEALKMLLKLPFTIGQREIEGIYLKEQEGN
jgi:hypothetical protein